MMEAWLEVKGDSVMKIVAHLWDKAVTEVKNGTKFRETLEMTNEA